MDSFVKIFFIFYKFSLFELVQVPFNEGEGIRQNLKITIMILTIT